jgi:ssDNA thymidine ADP-ribosyltransferase, DarT
MRAPANPKIYHIVHVDRLPSIVAEGRLWSDAEIGNRSLGELFYIFIRQLTRDRLLWLFSGFFIVFVDDTTIQTTNCAVVLVVVKSASASAFWAKL